MHHLPEGADIEQLRRQAKERLRAARAGDPDALAWIAQQGGGVRLSAAQLQIARDHGFSSWTKLQLEIARRRVLDLHDSAALADFVRRHPEAATAEVERWRDHPNGASPLGYLAMARFDTRTRRWRDVPGAAAAAHVLIAAGAPVDGPEGAAETPLITAASYGDADVAAVLIAAGADLEAVSAPDSGGVPGGTALLHAAVFGMTEVLDLLIAAGAEVRSPEEAAAAGDVSGWLDGERDAETGVRALVMAADHQRVACIDALVRAGVPVDAADAKWGRHPLRLAAQNGRPLSVAALLAHGADPTLADRGGATPLDLCRRSRAHAADPEAFDEIEAMLLAAVRRR